MGTKPPACERKNASNPKPSTRRNAMNASMTIQVLRRFAACWSYRFMWRSFPGQVHDRHVALGRVRHLEELRRLEAQRAGKQIGGKDLLRRVEARRDVVVELTREADL